MIVWYTVIAVAVLAVAFFALYLVYQRVNHRVEFGQSEFQQITVILVLLTILLVGMSGNINGEALAGLLGAVAGYVFGRRTEPSSTAPPQ